MGERKVLNKYYPPDFDPAKLPKISIPKDRQYVVRLMAPFTMRCLTCGDYVYKGKKFNARKENALGETYLGIQIYRFYIRCPKCLSEITFKTDPENTDYAVEHGAYRTFQASRLAELEEERLQQEREEEEASNPMVALENRTKESRREMDVIDALEDIRDWNARNAQVKHEDLLERHVALERRSRLELEMEEEEAIEREFRKERMKLRRVGEEEEEPQAPTIKKPRVEDRVVQPSKKLTGLVKVRKNERSNVTQEVAVERSKVTQEVAVERSKVTQEVASSQPSGLHLTAYSDSEESD